MENKEIALKLTLDAIGESTNIATVNNRMRLQKAIYLSQQIGIPLGYTYSWYFKGPYSPSLTQDYYNLNSALAAKDEDTKDLALSPEVLKKAQETRRLLQKPPTVRAEIYEWYEALCSLHYLMKFSKKSFKQAKEFMSEQKPHLDEIVDDAYAKLKDFKLVA